MDLGKDDSIGAKVYPEDDSPLAVLRSLLSAQIKISPELQSLIEAWKTLANPEQATLRIPAIPKIQ